MKTDIEDKTEKYKGKYKQFPQVQIYAGIMYYPKDGSFRFVEKED